MKEDAQQFLLDQKDYQKLNTLNKAKDLTTLSDGFYFKNSNKFPHRATVYEKCTQICKGTFYNSTKIESKKLYIMGVMESAVEIVTHTTIAQPISAREIHRRATMNKPSYHIKFMEELKIFLDKRRLSLEDTDSENEP